MRRISLPNGLENVVRYDMHFFAIQAISTAWLYQIMSWYTFVAHNITHCSRLRFNLSCRTVVLVIRSCRLYSLKMPRNEHSRHCFSDCAHIYPRDAVYAMALCLSVCLSVCHKPEFYRNVRTDCCVCRQRGYPSLCCMGIRVPTRVRVLLCDGSLSQTLILADISFFRHGTLIVASVVDMVRPSQVYHAERPPLFTKHTGRTQSVAWFVCDSWDLPVTVNVLKSSCVLLNMFVRNTLDVLLCYFVCSRNAVNCWVYKRSVTAERDPLLQAGRRCHT